MKKSGRRLLVPVHLKCHRHRMVCSLEGETLKATVMNIMETLEIFHFTGTRKVFEEMLNRNVTLSL